MTFIDDYAFTIVVFSPLVAALFIMLIPTKDVGSKVAVSRFFAAASLAAFLRLFFLFLEQSIENNTSLSFRSFNFQITFSLFLTSYNILLYGAAAVALLAHTFSLVQNDGKTNIHQVLPFILTFFLYVSFGQMDLRVALPLLSIANFFIYFLVGSSEKKRRGSTIFHMGIFLFSCDALILVLLQLTLFEGFSHSILLNIVMLLPALSRLCLPIFAPFAKRLFLNVDETNGPFIIVFLQFSGIHILHIIKRDFIEMSYNLNISITLIALVGAIFVVLMALTDRRTSMPYNFFIFYASLGTAVLFCDNSTKIWFFCLSLLLTNAICFFHTSRCAFLIDFYHRQNIYHPQSTALCFVTSALLIGVPGLGLGTSLWPALYNYIGLGLSTKNDPTAGFWISVSLFWVICLMMLSFASILSIREVALKKPSKELLARSNEIPELRFALFETLVVALLSWLIPLATIYTASLGV